MKILNVETLGGKMKRCLALLSVALLVSTLAAFGQELRKGSEPSAADKTASVGIAANGSGVMIAGDLWDSYMPGNRGPYSSEASRILVGDAIRIGNFERQWYTPTHMWPGGWTNGNFWNKDIYISVYDPDPTFNPATVPYHSDSTSTTKAVNPSNFGAASGTNYALAAYANKTALVPPRVVLGVGDPARDYNRETRWVDPQTRHHALYEAGWPTTVGVDVKLEVHQYSLNWNNFNDFIIMKITLTNTGNVDINADGFAEKTNHRIPAIALSMSGENMSSYMLTVQGARANRFGSQRAQAYMGDLDPKGNAWDMMVGFPGESAAGVKDMGLNDYAFRFYSDVWSGWSWLGVKRADGTTDKPTIFGTHPIGAGAQRGWYTSAGMGRGLKLDFDNPRGAFLCATSTWYVDGGKSRNSAALNLAPNPNFFASGTVGDVTTFVPKGSPARPNGDRKLLSEESASAFELNTYEPSWTKGFASPSNFDGDMYSGVGPFSLEVGESITVTVTTYGGFRLQGIQNAVAAARYIYDNGDALIDNYPAVPDMFVDFVPPGSPAIRWDNRAETHANFAGYKIYRASQAVPLNYEKTGMRGLDEYWRNMTENTPTPESLKKPMNPNFAAFDFIANRVGAPDGWGPYDLIKVIPKAQLGTYAAAVAPYSYVFVDPEAPMGLKFWYYVAAYTDAAVTLNATYSGTNAATTSFLETSNVNRNGASGLWEGAYPFATLNGDFVAKKASDPTFMKKVGAAVAVDHYRVAASQLVSGAMKVSVKPNPYKKRAMFDNVTDASDHKVIFYNLPPTAKVTILDVSGQIVQVLNFASTGLSNGTLFWNLFSKTGIEVASGLYIYVVEYDGGQQVGYLSILR